jgi:hypothetical protein
VDKRVSSQHWMSASQAPARKKFWSRKTFSKMWLCAVSMQMGNDRCGWNSARQDEGFHINEDSFDTMNQYYQQ